MIVKLLTEHHLEFRSLKGGCRGSSESTHVKMPHCCKSHALAHLCVCFLSVYLQPLVEKMMKYTNISIKSQVSCHKVAEICRPFSYLSKVSAWGMWTFGKLHEPS